MSLTGKDTGPAACCHQFSETSAPCRTRTCAKFKPVQSCRVCGDDTTGMYFGAVVCLPCKTFFIRYGSEGTDRLRCRSGKSCDITITTRTRCKHCRLLKCYAVGMVRKERPEVIYASEGQELCSVCRDLANGIHFGTYTCEGCKKFFRRCLKENHTYKCADKGDCKINPRNRNTCRYCRLQRCLAVGMTTKVKVGRPRKVQREIILSAIHNMNGLTSSKPGISHSSLSSNESSQSEDGDTSTQSADGGGFRQESDSCSNLGMSRCDSYESLLSDDSTVLNTASQTGNDYAEQHTDLTINEEQREMQTLLPGVEQEGACKSAGTGQVCVGGFTYLLSESLTERFFEVVLPYWTQPRLPGGGLPYTESDQMLVEQLRCAHVNARHAIRGPKPSQEILTECSQSGNLGANVGEFLQQRLVRILTAFISFVKSQKAFEVMHELDISTMIRMTMNTWALVATAAHQYDPVQQTLPDLIDLPLHPNNPHTALNERNLYLADRLHGLQLDDAEAALLSVCCVLATDLLDLKNTDIVENIRSRFIEIFRAYTTVKCGWPNRRMEDIFAIVPELRLTAIWFNDLSYTTWFPSNGNIVV